MLKRWKVKLKLVKENTYLKVEITNSGQETSNGANNQGDIELNVEIDHAADGNAASDGGMLNVQHVEATAAGKRRDAERGDARR